MNWQGIVLPIAVAFATAIAANWVQRPKIKADASKSETDEEVALRELRLKEQAAALESAWAATKRAEAACSACETKLETTTTRLESKYDRLVAASENLADAVQGILDAPDDIAARQTARLRLREYRQAI